MGAGFGHTQKAHFFFEIKINNDLVISLVIYFRFEDVLYVTVIILSFFDGEKQEIGKMLNKYSLAPSILQNSYRLNQASTIFTIFIVSLFAALDNLCANAQIKKELQLVLRIAIGAERSLKSSVENHVAHQQYFILDIAD